MAGRGAYFMANHIVLTAPDDVEWSDNVVGVGGNGRQKRSPYQRLVLRRRVAPDCVNWFQFDNTTLSSFVCLPPRSVPWVYERYTDATCISIECRYNAGMLTEVVATFDIMTEV